MSEANKELVRRHFGEIFDRGNLDACDETVTVVYIEHAVAPFGSDEPGRVKARSTCVTSRKWLRAQFPDLTMTVEKIVAEGDIVAALAHSQGTNLGPHSTACFPPQGGASALTRATGLGSRTTSWRSTGRRGRIS